MDKVVLKELLARFSEPWSPRVVAELNGQHVKLVKLKGEFVWHHHEHEDELFLVLHGRMQIHLRDRIVHLGEGELFVVPRGVEHKPVAEVEAHVLLLEPATTLNTGNLRNTLTVATPERLRRDPGHAQKKGASADRRAQRGAAERSCGGSGLRPDPAPQMGRRAKPAALECPLEQALDECATKP
jgi:mannose-6-phosphate isomerase-like protein (cupin superfamily)